MEEQIRQDPPAIRRSSKHLFTPGPLTTSSAVKEAMLRDLGSSDDEFIAVVRQIRRELGFHEYLQPDLQSDIIISFRYPAHPNFTFREFYARLNDKGFVIYPCKVSNADCFRIGTIGRIYEGDVWALMAAVRATLDEMQIALI